MLLKYYYFTLKGHISPIIENKSSLIKRMMGYI